LSSWFERPGYNKTKYTLEIAYINKKVEGLTLPLSWHSSSSPDTDTDTVVNNQMPEVGGSFHGHHGVTVRQ